MSGKKTTPSGGKRKSTPSSGKKKTTPSSGKRQSIRRRTFDKEEASPGVKEIIGSMKGDMTVQEMKQSLMKSLDKKVKLAGKIIFLVCCSTVLQMSKIQACYITFKRVFSTSFARFCKNCIVI